ncbi:hypothetical protein ACN2C7_10075 [Caulobacter sp. ErkDOM-E]|uniref:hypothetical protein n=1 Tax=Caulobacter sp. ErkDOM-E TaxID=3402778 RepID=UPI003AF75FF8
MAMLHAIMPKDDWLAEMRLSHSWPVHGLPERLHADNAKEFGSTALGRGCSQFQIVKTHRPPGKPRYGALIERFIGTMMGEVHVLPGTTFSNVALKGDYDSDKHAEMTLDEFDRWFALQIIEYHAKGHSGIGGFSPLSKWVSQ